MVAKNKNRQSEGEKKKKNYIVPSGLIVDHVTFYDVFMCTKCSVF